MRTIVVATHSKGKFPEIIGKLDGLQFEFKNLTDKGYPADFDMDEPGETFEGNASIKAMTIGKQTDELSLADDAGLVVDALGGRPGVRSARYVPGTDEDRYQKLLKELESVPDEERTARFVSVVAVHDPKNDKVLLAKGTCEGHIAREPKGTNGFGYDPVFISADTGRHLAELTVAEKNETSHRGKALAQMKKLLDEEYKD